MIDEIEGCNESIMKITISFETSGESVESPEKLKPPVYRRDRAEVSNAGYPADTHVGSRRRMSPVRETAFPVPTMFK